MTLDERGTLSEGFRRLGVQLPQRMGSGASRGNLREVQAAMAKDTQLQSLLACRVRTTGDQLVWQQAINRFLQSADEETIGIWLGELAERYLAKGDLAMAALTLEQLVARVPHQYRTTIGASVGFAVDTSKCHLFDIETEQAIV